MYPPDVLRELGRVHEALHGLWCDLQDLQDQSAEPLTSINQCTVNEANKAVMSAADRLEHIMGKFVANNPRHFEELPK